ncbi:MAG: glycine--tRNA ligase subunit beta, partial [Gammaproteobacteria bacterium]|nr:glycine--tRNA ligase subunit beta [Phycisphaerae bacterium]NIR94941.1 glycine--tRNA ligase subunit beta [Gammaproteobacteria bacterium]NIW45375.1 glycine--tRNA ligase subunit beta [Gammaproteobacteria bacterium]NIX30158.1 glycine--tRNA ligase subunit beta [Phycisphaerae bacterium]NIX56597.1 glycine--tRNA ligase subunit beta [candidate division Zixibacteria bacterium]
LSKCDLVTSLVGEFPELQGITGKYLAQNDKEDQDICLAIEEHYQPRFAGDQLPESEIGQIVALADKLDTLAGIFGIGQQPGGAKDPFALRRAALGVVRILVEKKIPLSISELVEAAYSVQPENIEKTQTDLINFILERAKGYFVDHGHTITAIDSVLQPAGADTTLYTLPD